MTNLAWLIPVFPFAAFVLIALGARRSRQLSAGLTVLGVLAAFVMSVLVLVEVLGGRQVSQSINWVPLAINPTEFRTAFAGEFLRIGFLVDPLTSVMLVVVTSVSLLVQIYSTAYLRRDPHAEGHVEERYDAQGYDEGYARYFGVMGLFTASMLGLVLANNFLTIYIFWELVGLASYLLIGHWHYKPSAAYAAKKAFLVTRLGDFGFLLGILFFYGHTGTFQFSELIDRAARGQLPEPVITVGMLLVFCGAVGKSAQFPLHDWLPDAMEGPTPVSALIHAATMVAAGVYLMARTFPILEHSPTAMAVVATIGAFTAIFAATMGLVSPDIKRVLAYSTVSQLGYMMLAIGVGAMSAGMFHLFNHAFFKALLFLGAGSVIHLVGTNDIFGMGGLRRWRGPTFVAMVFAALSLAGLPPFSGFWSKDEILVATARQNPVLFVLAMITVFLTAFYMFRVLFVAFTGPYRGGHDEHFHPESPAMLLPVVLLVIPSVISGLWGSPFLNHAFASFIEGHPAHPEFQPAIAGISSILALAGILLAWQMYGGGKREPGAAMTQRLRPLYDVLMSRYGVPSLYDWIGGRLTVGLGWLIWQFDRLVVDGIVNGVGRTAVFTGGWLRQIQSGQVQTYAWVLFAGVLTLAVVAAIWR